MQKENLTTKNIRDFTEEDTLYISVPGARGYGRYKKLCQFIGLVGNRVHGKVIDDCQDSGTEWQGQIIGEEIDGKIEHCSLYGKSKSGENSCYHSLNVLGFFVRETEIKSDDDLSGVPSEHESYGMIGLSRRTSSYSTPMFGSSIQHKEYIVLTIHDANIKRGLSSDWIHANKKVAEINMSQEQFTQMITSFGMGDGVPCTLKHVNGKTIKSPPYQSKRDQFQNEFNERMKELKEDVQRLIEDSLQILENKKTLNKADRKHILDAIKRLTQEIGSNVPFVSKQFGEQMDKTVSEAKGDIEAFFSQKVTSLGLDAYKDELKKHLGTGDNIENVKIED